FGNALSVLLSSLPFSFVPSGRFQTAWLWPVAHASGSVKPLPCSRGSVSKPRIHLTLFEDLAVFTGDAHAAHATAGQRLQFITDSRGDTARSEHHHVRDIDRHGLFGDTTLDLLGRVRPGMPLYDGNSFDGQLAGEAIHFKHTSRFSFVAPGNDTHHIVFADFDAVRTAFAFFLSALIGNFRH